MKNKKYKVVSLHPYTKCNMNCPFCYKEKSNKEKPKQFWYDLIPYISKLTNQTALGGGEPFMDIPFVIKFSALCKKNKLICNVTSNGRLLIDLNDRELKNTLKNITMVSLSFDEYKCKFIGDINKYTTLIKRIKKLTKTQVGSNLLVTKKILGKNGIALKNVVDGLFKHGIDRVFALTPKNIPCPDILKFKLIYQYLTIKHKHFYLDDLGKMILEEEKYSNWKNKCHYGEGLISINENGIITGCSFDCSDKALLRLKNPKDILKITKIKPKERFSCPYLNRKK